MKDSYQEDKDSLVEAEIEAVFAQEESVYETALEAMETYHRSLDDDYTKDGE